MSFDTSSGHREPILFERWPLLREKIPWLSLGAFPTPVERMSRLGERLGHDDLWVKRDDLSGPLYGGNKVRKLEFTLADVQRKGGGPIVTAGAVGSNHVVATAVYAASVGIDVVALLVPQPVQKNLRTNLLTVVNQGTRLEPVASQAAASARLAKIVAVETVRNGRAPYFLWVGGSSLTGVYGYIEFALELEKQVAAGLLPEPEYVLLPVGSGGTIAGVVAGLKLTRLKTRALGVRVYDPIFANERVVALLADQTLRKLRRLDSTVPDIRVTVHDVVMLHEFFGKGYARYTRSGVEAMALLEETEGFDLEGTYSGKAAAGLVALAQSEAGRAGPLLFLDTYNSQPIDPLLEGAPSPETLPSILREYFEQPIAEVDDDENVDRFE